MLLIYLGLCPWLLGKPWTKVISGRLPDAQAYGIGFFTELALFHIIAFPGIMFYLPFSVIVICFSVALAGCCGFCLWFIWRNRLFPRWKAGRVRQLFWYEWVLLAAVIGVIGYQVVRGALSDFTHMTFDDAVYTTAASDALASGQAATINAYTGRAGSLIIKRAIQTALYFPAWLSAASGVPVATVEHTVQYVQLILLAYLIYTYMAGELFEKPSDRLIFLLVIGVFYIFGYHSHYSLTFRILGPNYQGKAVLAVSLTPLVLTILIRKLNEPYQWKTGLLLLLFSLAAVSLTLWGTGTMAVIVAVPVVLSLFRKERNWKHLLYIPWGCIAPAGFGLLYLLYRFAV